jgi:hypothetical protein
MARQGINTGITPNDGTGDSLLSGAIKINDNFSEIYSAFGDGNNLISYVNTAGVATVAGNLSGTPNLNVGVVTATSFSGSGSNITGISTLNIVNYGIGLGGTGDSPWVPIDLPGNGLGTYGQPLGIHTTKHVGIGRTADSATVLYVEAATVGSAGTPFGLRVDGFADINNVRFDYTTEGYTRFLFPSFINTVGGDGSGYGSALQYDQLNSVPFHIRSHSKFTRTVQIGTSFYDLGDGPILYPGIFMDGGSATIAVGLGITINGGTGIITATGFSGGAAGVNVSGTVTATSFSGDGSGLTGVVAEGTGVVIQEDGSPIGTAATINFIGTGVTATLSNGVASVEISSTGGYWASTPSGIHTLSSVGIGTTNPPADLSVYGDVFVSGFSTFTNNVYIKDSKAAIFGDNLELQIFNDGTNSYIDNFSANNLVIRDDGIGIQFRRYAGFPSAGLMAAFNVDAGVELYYDSVLKLQTFQNGVAINDSVGIGSTAGNPPYRLTVSGVGATITSGLENAIADLTSSVDGYGQVNIRNSLSASSASGDLVITADIGDDSSNFINFGINNTGFSTSSWTINGALDGYMYSSDSNFSIGVASANKYLSFFVGDTLIENEKIRVTETGVGIGTTVAGSTLTVEGDARFSGIVTASRFESVSAGTPTIDSPNNLNINAVTVAISTDLTVGDSIVAAGQTINSTGVQVTGIITSSNFRSNDTVGDGSDVGFAIKYYVTADGASAYRFAGPGLVNTTNNPTIYLHRGFTYIFENSTGANHPFAIRYSDGGTGYGSTYLSGSQEGTQIFTVPFDAPNTLVYQCTIHAGMVGTFNIVT